MKLIHYIMPITLAMLASCKSTPTVGGSSNGIPAVDIKNTHKESLPPDPRAVAWRNYVGRGVPPEQVQLDYGQYLSETYDDWNLESAREEIERLRKIEQEERDLTNEEHERRWELSNFVGMLRRAEEKNKADTQE